MNYYFITLNIGLNNNPLGFEETVNEVKEHGLKVKNFKRVISEYQGNEEPTAVVNGSIYLGDIDDVHALVQNLCIDLTQECIAYKINRFMGKIAFNPRMDVTKFDFDQQYFID
jgi:hypothetical protein